MPVAWNRLADATQQAPAAKLPLSVVTLGDVHAEDLQALTPWFQRIEQLVLDIAPRDPLASHRAELNRAIDAATADWVLIVREREVIGDDLAREIAEATAAAKARGFRIRSVPVYAGRPLTISRDDGAVRLFHRRYYLRYANKGEWIEINVQGTVVRLREMLRSITFPSPEAHREYLASNAVRHSKVRQVLLFISYVLSTRTRDANTLRYLWIEAGFDVAR